jgi:uncharacterized delta-60 repeat protein
MKTVREKCSQEYERTMRTSHISKQRWPLRALAGISLLASAAITCQAQWPKADDFNPGASRPVFSLAVQADGKILVGGVFTTLGGQPRNYIGRLNGDGTLDTTFNPGAGGTDYPCVYSLAVQADGKILVGGSFSTLGGQPRNRIGRLNGDGTLDITFSPGASSSVSSLAVQADGKILVGGSFTNLAGQTRNRIGRLNSDGTLDTNFNPGASSSVSSLAVQADGKILVGGSFTTLGGQTRNRIGRLNSDGTLDTNFNPGASSSVSSLVVQADGKILVGGGFSTLGGQTRNYIGRLNADGTLDSFNPGASSSVYSLAVQADGKILVGGGFSTLGGQTRNCLGRLNADGTLDSFNPGASSSVSSLAVQADGKILVGGGFSTLGGQTRNDIGRLNNTQPAAQTLSYDGSTLTWLRSGTSPEVWRTSFDASTNNGTDWFSLGTGTRIGGGWELTGVSVATNANIRARGFLTGGQNNGSTWLVESIIGPLVVLSQPVSRTNNAGTVATFTVAAGGTPRLSYQWLKGEVNLSDGGNTSGAQTSTLTLSNVLGGDTGRYSVIISNAFGSVTSLVATLTVLEPLITSQPVSRSVNAGDTVGFSVTAVGTAPLGYQWRKDGVAVAVATTASLTFTNVQGADEGGYDVVVSNQFGSATSAVALLTVNLAVLDTDFDPGANSSVYSLAVQADGKILVGGYFTTLGGQTRNYIGRLNGDGKLDTTFNPGANSYVTSLAVQADGKILVGGNFTTLGEQARNCIGRLNSDGTLDTTFNPGADGWVNSLAVQTDGKILVGGNFSTLGGQTRNHIGRLNSDGTLDSGFDPGAAGASYPYVSSLAVQTDGKILVGGNFSTLGGQTRNYIGRLNRDGTLDTTFNPGASSTVYSLAVQADGKILVGGGFTTLGGQTRNCIGRFNSDGTLDTTFNPGANSYVTSLAVQADGKILVGGYFTTLGGQTRNGIGRLNSDGTLDTTFTPAADDYVSSLAVQADGKILVGGYFTTLAGQPRNCIGRLNNTEPATQSLSYEGSTLTWLRGGTSPEVWRTSFDTSTNRGIDWVSLGAGARLSGGWQLTAVSVPTNANIRARGFLTGGVGNGSAWFVESIIGPLVVLSQPISRTNNAGTVATFSVAAGGTPPLSYQWLKGGVNLSDSGNTSGAQTSTLMLSNVLGGDAGRYSVIISNAFGSVTSVVATLTVLEPLITSQPVSRSVNVGDTVGFSVTAVGTAPLGYQWRKDGVAVGVATTASLTFTNVQGADEGGYDVVVSNQFGSVTSAVALLTVNLATADAFNPGASNAGASSAVYTTAVQADGKILVGGQFTTLGGQTCNNIGRLNSDGTLDTTFSPGANGFVDSLAIQADGKILVGGGFNTLGGQTRNCIGRLNSDGTLDTTFNPGANSSVYSLAVQTDGKILVGGRFTTLGGQTRNYIGRLNGDGTLETAFNPQAGAIYYPYVDSLAVQADGKILVGGGFNTLGGQPRNYIGRLNSNGTLDTTFNPDAGFEVDALAVQADGKILVGGWFTTLGGQTRNHIGRLNGDGTLDTSFNPGASDVVWSLAVQADGKILVGGWFWTLGGQTRNRIGRLNSDGALDTTFNPGANGDVIALAVQADGKVLVGGYFTTLGGQTRNSIGRLNNTDPATHSLSYDGATITWLRGGTSPEVWCSTFAALTNGTDWVSLGAGVRITGGWQLTGVSLPPNATIRARGYVTGGSVNGSSWFVESFIGLPIILSQPLNRVVGRGNAGTLTALGGGTEPLNYQWTFNGTNLPGASNAMLNVLDFQLSDVGLYAVVVSNALGSITSSNAILDIAMFITNEPANLIAPAGSAAVFNVDVFGYGPLTYQWRVNGTNIPGAVAASLIISNARPADVAYYSVVVTDPFGQSITSQPAWLGLGIAGDGTGLLGAYYSDRLDFTGLPTLTRIDPTVNFDWGYGPPDPLISTDLFTVRWTGQVQAPDSQTYTFYTRTDDGVRLWVNGQKVIDKWVDQPATEWSGTIALNAGQIYPIVIEYYDIMEVALAVLSWSSPTQLKAVIPQSQLYPATPPVISLQPQSQLVAQGSNATFMVQAGGEQPMAYRWRKNGITINGATSASLILANVQERDQGLYSVVVSNALGSVTSSEAMLVVNQPPVADASATQPMVISANGVNARVVLNGTRSSDPDGDLLQCAWYEAGNPNALAGGALTVVVLPAGAHSLLLVVSDGMLAATNAVTVEVITTAQAVERLIAQVTASWPRSRPLVATLEAALASIRRGNPVSAINQLQAFQNKVQAQVAPSNPVLAQAFIHAAKQVVDALDGGDAGEVAAKLHSVKHQSDGKLHFKFSGAASRVQIVEASTNLVDWEIIGVAVEQGNGLYEFEDTCSTNLAGRFYRIKQLPH